MQATGTRRAARAVDGAAQDESRVTKEGLQSDSKEDSPSYPAVENTTS